MTPKNRGYALDAEVYNVQERMQDSGVPGEWDDYPDWWEYKVSSKPKHTTRKGDTGLGVVSGLGAISLYRNSTNSL